MPALFDKQQQQAADYLVQTLQAKGIDNLQLLTAIRATPRHLFVDPIMQQQAYADHALSIACGQTISQPFIVALMTQALLAAGPLTTVLEIGTGSGYQAAILARLVDEVYTVERLEPLYLQAQQRLQQLQISNIHCLFADGKNGWPAHAPYDGILVTAAAEEIPHQLIAQMSDGGRMLIPIGPRDFQELCLVIKRGQQIIVDRLEDVCFVPLV